MPKTKRGGLMMADYDHFIETIEFKLNDLRLKTQELLFLMQEYRNQKTEKENLLKPVEEVTTFGADRFFNKMKEKTKAKPSQKEIIQEAPQASEYNQELFIIQNAVQAYASDRARFSTTDIILSTQLNADVVMQGLRELENKDYIKIDPYGFISLN